MNAKITAAFLIGLLVSTTAVAMAADDGWVTIFNGRDLTGWKQINGKATYCVEDGAIVGTTVKGSANSFLCT